MARSRLPGSFVRLSRGSVHYELSGPSGGPVVVLVGGLSVPYSTWDKTVPALTAAGFRVLRYDHFGRGYSDRPRAGYGLDCYIEQLAELVDALGLARPVSLVGLSMGGPVVAAAAVRYPGLASSAAFIAPLVEWPEQTGSSRLLSLPLVGEAIMAIKGGAVLAGGQRSDFSSEKEFESYLPSYLPQLEYRGIARAILATVRSIPSWPLADVYETLGETDLPVLLFWGRQDKTLSFGQSERFLRSVSRAAFFPIDGTGHVPQWERPEVINAALIEFLGF